MDNREKELFGSTLRAQQEDRAKKLAKEANARKLAAIKAAQTSPSLEERLAGDTMAAQSGLPLELGENISTVPTSPQPVVNPLGRGPSPKHSTGGGALNTTLASPNNSRGPSGYNASQTSQASAGNAGINGGGDGAMNAPKNTTGKNNFPPKELSNNLGPNSLAQEATLDYNRAKELGSGVPTMTPEQKAKFGQAGPATPRLGAFDSQGNPIKSGGGTLSVVGYGTNSRGQDMSPQAQLARMYDLQAQEDKRNSINYLQNRLNRGNLHGAGARVLASLLNANTAANAKTETTNTANQLGMAKLAATINNNRATREFNTKKLAAETGLGYDKLAETQRGRDLDTKLGLAKLTQKQRNDSLGNIINLMGKQTNLIDPLKGIDFESNTVAQDLLRLMGSLYQNELGFGNKAQ